MQRLLAILAAVLFLGSCSSGNPLATQADDYYFTGPFFWPVQPAPAGSEQWLADHRKYAENVRRPYLGAFQVQIGEGLPDEGVDSFFQAVDAWNEFIGFDVFFEEEFPWKIVVVGRDQPVGRWAQASYKDHLCFIEVDPVAFPLPYVFAHELGHCLGFGHSTDEEGRDSIMKAPAGKFFTDDMARMVKEKIQPVEDGFEPNVNESAQVNEEPEEELCHTN